jgi:hypothetical protein
MAYETTLELRNLLQEEVNDTAPSAETQTRYVNLLNRAHQNIVAGGSELNVDDSGNPIRRPFIFPWAVNQDPIIINLLPAQEGSASVTNQSSSVTIDINSATTDLTGYHVRFDNERTVYRITAHAALVITLDGIYLGDTAAAINYEAFKLIYEIGASTPLTSNILLPTDKLRSYDNEGTRYTISMIDSGELFDKHPLARVRERTPRWAGILKQGDGTLTIQFDSYPKELQRVEFWYVPKPEELDTVSVNPILPKHHRTILVHLAAFYHLRKRDDDRAVSQLKTARDMWNDLTTEARQILGGNDADFGYVAPWPGGFDGSVRTADFIDVDVP